MDVIDRFDGEYRWLSNFWPCPIIMEEWTFPSAEHAYQAGKSIHPNDWRFIQGLTAGQAKRAGRRLPLRGDWEQIKVPFMAAIIQEKFKIPELRNLLIQTGERELIEGNDWGDTFWGVSRGRGQNMLGKLLMHERAHLIHSP